MTDHHGSTGLETATTGLESTVAFVASPLPLQEATGGPQEVVILVFVALFVATALSIYLAARLYRGYRKGGGTGMLVLGTGLVLLTTVPMVLRLVLSNTPAVGPVWQETIATAVQLLGLVLILGVVYGRR